MSVIDDVKQRTDIVDLVSQYVTLKRSGKSYMANCPFHMERTPSFHVDPARQTWHCFGACGTGGDVFRFIMKKEGCEFREALTILAARAGVSLQEQRDTGEDARRARLFDINEAAAAFFQHALETPGGAAARSYLEERRVAARSIDAFQLGYAAQAWDTLVRHLDERGFAERDVVASGVAIAGERGAYDRFRHRLMFPIRDERGRIAGFGGRSLPGDESGATGAKYVNSAQSPIFDKGSLLYALDRAKDAVRSDGAVIVEGYMDAIAAHEHGFANVVASMGTALTERQVQLLKRYTRSLTLALDADAAGSEATLRGVEVVADAVDREDTVSVNWRGVIRHQNTLAADIRVLTMPEGRDPDDVIRADAEQWKTLVASAKPVLDHLFDTAASTRDLSSPRERSAIVAQLAPMVAGIADRVVQSHYVQRLARLAQVDEATLRLELRQPVSQPTSRSPRAGTVQSAPPDSNAQRKLVRDKREEFCLALLIRYPELRSEATALSPELFSQSENRALFDALVEWTYEGESRDRPPADTSFEASLSADLLPQYERVINLELPLYDDDALAQALRSTVWGIEQQRLRLAKRASVAALSDATSEDAASIAERARSAWERGETEPFPAEEEADPATAFVDDMETGLKIHQRLLEQQRDTGRFAR